MSDTFDLSPYYAEQRALAARVTRTDELPDPVRFVGGCDVAYFEKQDRMIGAVTVLDARTLEVVESAYHDTEITFPYIPGLFSFREIPTLVAAYRALVLKPDLLICDGHGVAHPQGLGMASHLGLILNTPTVGCAKSRLVGEWDREGLDERKGATVPLLHGGREIGRILRSRHAVRPLFVSTGHRVSLDTAVRWVLRATPSYRLPETTRSADQLVNRLRKSALEKQ